MLTCGSRPSIGRFALLRENLNYLARVDTRPELKVLLGIRCNGKNQSVHHDLI